MKPLLFLDVDGVLSIDVSLSQARKRRLQVRHHHSWDGGRVRILLAREHTALLREAAEDFDLVWGTTWNAEANALASDHLFIAAMPVAEVPSDANGWPRTGKLPYLRAYAEGRPFVWVDDEITEEDLAAMGPGEHGVRVASDVGLRVEDLARARSLVGATGH